MNSEERGQFIVQHYEMLESITRHFASLKIFPVSDLENWFGNIVSILMDPATSILDRIDHNRPLRPYLQAGLYTEVCNLRGNVDYGAPEFETLVSMGVNYFESNVISDSDGSENLYKQQAHDTFMELLDRIETSIRVDLGNDEGDTFAACRKIFNPAPLANFFGISRDEALFRKRLVCKYAKRVKVNGVPLKEWLETIKEDIYEKSTKPVAVTENNRVVHLDTWNSDYILVVSPMERNNPLIRIDTNPPIPGLDGRVFQVDSEDGAGKRYLEFRIRNTSHDSGYRGTIEVNVPCSMWVHQVPDLEMEVTFSIPKKRAKEGWTPKEWLTKVVTSQGTSVPSDCRQDEMNSKEFIEFLGDVPIWDRPLKSYSNTFDQIKILTGRKPSNRYKGPRLMVSRTNGGSDHNARYYYTRVSAERVKEYLIAQAEIRSIEEAAAKIKAQTIPVLDNGTIKASVRERQTTSK